MSFPKYLYLFLVAVPLSVALAGNSLTLSKTTCAELLDLSARIGFVAPSDQLERLRDFLTTPGLERSGNHGKIKRLVTDAQQGDGRIRSVLYLKGDDIVDLFYRWHLSQYPPSKLPLPSPLKKNLTFGNLLIAKGVANVSAIFALTLLFSYTLPETVERVGKLFYFLPILFLSKSIYGDIKEYAHTLYGNYDPFEDSLFKHFTYGRLVGDIMSGSFTDQFEYWEGPLAKGGIRVESFYSLRRSKSGEPEFLLIIANPPKESPGGGGFTGSASPPTQAPSKLKFKTIARFKPTIDSVPFEDVSLKAFWYSRGKSANPQSVEKGLGGIILSRIKELIQVGNPHNLEKNFGKNLQIFTSDDPYFPECFSLTLASDYRLIFSWKEGEENPTIKGVYLF